MDIVETHQFSTASMHVAAIPPVELKRFSPAPFLSPEVECSIFIISIRWSAHSFAPFARVSSHTSARVSWWSARLSLWALRQADASTENNR